MNRVTRFLSVLVIVLFFSVSAFATESGGGAYANGAEGTVTGMLPPPGFYAINYVNFYRADSFKDNNGDTLMGGKDFNVTTAVEVLRLLTVTNKTFLGGNFGSYVLIPVANVSLTTPAGSQTKTGLADITVAPFLCWHAKNFHWATAMDFVLPTGAYDENDIANIGRNYYTVEPLVAMTYMADNGVELSAKLMYDYNTENNDTNYQSGNEFHIDYTAAYHYKKWTFGLTGYYYQQVTDDELDGDKIDDFKGKAMAAGPLVSYSYNPGHFITVKYQKEFDVENKPSGEKIWVKALFTF
jgi:hypothetical protein